MKERKNAGKPMLAKMEKTLMAVIVCLALLLVGLLLYLRFGGGIRTRGQSSERLSATEETPRYVYPDLREQDLVYQFALGPNGCLLMRETQEESNIIPVDEDSDGFPDYGYYYEMSAENPEEPSRSVRVELYAENGLPFATYAAYPVAAPTEPPSPYGWREENGLRYYVEETGQRSVGLKRMDGKLYYFNYRGECARSLGVDVSFYDEQIDWQAVKEQGIDFAIVRVGGRGWSSGLQYGDIRTQENLRGARAAGLKVGVYFFSTAVNPHEAVEDAKTALATVGGIPLDFPIFIDMEYSGVYPEGRADRLTGAERAAIATAFCETVRNSGYQAGVYSAQNYFKYAMDYNAIADYTVWLASYTRDHLMPNFSRRYDIWQFSDSGLVKGIAGHCDLDAIF